MAGYDIVSRYLPEPARATGTAARLCPSGRCLRGISATAVKGLPFTPGLFAPFLAAVETARSQPPSIETTFKGTTLGMKMESLML